LKQGTKFSYLVVLIAAASGLTPAIGQTSNGENAMNPNPSSPIDRHRYILLLRIIAANAGEWLPDARQSGSQTIEQRDVFIEAQIGEVLKAPDPLGRDLKFKVKQRRPTDGFRADDYGPWSDVDPVSGIELLAFANDPVSGASIERVLADGCGLLVKVPSPQVPFAVEDVRRALAWEKAFGRQLLDSEQARRSIRAERALIGPIMAGYLVDSIAGGDLADPATARAHEFVIELLRAPDVNERFRLVILAHEINELTMTETPPVWFRARLITSMIHILEQENAELLHGPIRQTYLINSVFKANGEQLITAGDVFTTDAQRATFESVLRKRGFSPEQEAQLIRWAGGK
jgi:hypothetical protein